MPKDPSPVAADLDRDLERLRIVGPDEPPAPRRRRRRMGRWLLVLAVLGAAGAYAAASMAPKPPVVEVVAVRPQEIGMPPVLLSAVGYIVPFREITVAASAQGRIVEMPVEENQAVRAGDLLARLESGDADARLSLALAERDEAARELRVTRQLFKRGVRSSSELERAETAFQQADARAELARVTLESTVLRAPFDGTVIRKLRDVGELLTIGVTAQGDPGTGIVTLAVLDPLEVELEINEGEIRKLRPGMSALIVPEAQPDQRFLGSIREIASRADRSKGVVPVRVTIEDPGDALLPDMTVKVRFLEQPPSGAIETQLAIPRSALAWRNDEPVVFMVEDDRAIAMPVAMGAWRGNGGDPSQGYAAVARAAVEQDGWVPVIEGPPEGAFVVNAPPRTLQSGAKVQLAQ